MATILLDRVFCDDFEANSLPASSANALVAILDRTTELQELRTALADGVISVDSIRRRIELAIGDYQQDIWFPHTTGIAALLLGMCHSYDPDAKRCLDLISQLTHRELRMIRDTAKICLVRKSRDPQQTERFHDFKRLILDPDPDSLSFTQMSEQLDDGSVTAGVLDYASA